MRKNNIFWVLTIVLLACLSTMTIAQVKDITEEDALNAIMSADEDMQEMVDSGFSVTKVNDTLIEAKEAFAGENYSKLLADLENVSDIAKREQAKKLMLAAEKALGSSKGDYPLAIDKTNQITEMKTRAYEVYDLISALEIRIDEMKDIIKLEDAEQKLSDAKNEFYAESYDTAEEFANQGFVIVDKKAAEATELNLIYTAGKENIEGFFRAQWKNVLIGIAIALAVGSVLYWQLSIILKRRRLENLKLERQVLLDLMKKAQHERFSKGLITNREYEIKTSKFKERLVEVEKDIPVFESKLHMKATIKKAQEGKNA